ncbi:MAG: hypothetical protein ACHQ02_08535 [Candidatus Limnocylindrales bacterium]
MIGAALVVVVAIGLAGPQAAPTATDALALVPPVSAPPTAAARTPAVRSGGMACLPAPTPFDPTAFDLTGTWTGVDGGMYDLRQVGSTLWWQGVSDWDGGSGGIGVRWVSMGHGTIDGLRITAAWIVLRGIDEGSGTLSLEIQDNGQGNIQIVTREQSGGFGNTLWLPATCRSL